MLHIIYIFFSYHFFLKVFGVFFGCGSRNHRQSLAAFVSTQAGVQGRPKSVVVIDLCHPHQKPPRGRRLIKLLSMYFLYFFHQKLGPL